MDGITFEEIFSSTSALQYALTNVFFHNALFLFVFVKTDGITIKNNKISF